MSRVFITQQPRPNKLGWTPNLSRAAGYGNFVYIFEAEDKPWANPNASVDKAIAVLSEFNPDTDYLLYPNSGDPLGAMIVFMVISRFSFSQVKMLYWERKLENGVRSPSDGFYSPITINLPIL